LIFSLVEFSYYFHYCKNLKFEDRPDYSTLKLLFYDLLLSQENITSSTEFVMDWFSDNNTNQNLNDINKGEDESNNQTFMENDIKKKKFI